MLSSMQVEKSFIKQTPWKIDQPSLLWNETTFKSFATEMRTVKCFSWDKLRNCIHFCIYWNVDMSSFVFRSSPRTCLLFVSNTPVEKQLSCKNGVQKTFRIFRQTAKLSSHISASKTDIEKRIPEIPDKLS